MAITDDIALYALGYVSAESHPARIDALCLNTVQRKTPCDACTEACPADIVLYEGDVDWRACVDCGLCVAACPTQAISASGAHWASVESAVASQSSYAVFACERYAGNADVVVTCLAALPWDELAAVALKKTLVIKTSPCRDCPHAECVAHAKGLVSKLRDFLGAEEFARRVFPRVPSAIAAEESSDLRKGTERRRAFSTVSHTVRQGALNLMSDDTPPASSRSRAFLMNALSGMPEGERPALTWRTLVEDGRCEGCGICVKMCPNGALSFGTEDETDTHNEGASASVQPRAVSLDHNASLCTECGLCYISCPRENLGGWDDVCTTEVPAVHRNPIDVDVCEKCGRFFKKESGKTRCAACSRFRFSPSHR